MISRLLDILLRRRHFWRAASFSEISELYTARTIRIIGLNLGAGFASIYLFKIGYSLDFIMLFWVIYLLYRMIIVIPSVHLVAYYGPKHGIYVSNLLYVPAMIFLAILPQADIVSIIGWGLFAGFSMTLYNLCYLVDFSKVKDINHSGKEIGYMHILEKIALALSPILGGLIALLFSPEIVMWVAAAAILAASLPLMSSSEPTKTHQKIEYKGFPWSRLKRTLIAEFGVGYDIFSISTIWGLHLAATIFASTGNAVYISIGALSGATVIVGLVSAKLFGKLIDSNKGGELLRYSVIINALTHLSRPLANTTLEILAVNTSNEAATTGLNMARLRGLFDTADFSGYRILYLSIAEMMSIFGAFVASLVGLILLHFIDDADTAFSWYYVIAAPIVLIVATSRFRIYSKK